MGSTAIAYHPSDEATARSVADQLEGQGEDVKLITLSDQIEKLDQFERSIIIWSRASLNSAKFDDIWRLLDRRQHVILGDITSDELPERVPYDQLLVVGDDAVIVGKQPTEESEPDRLHRIRRSEVMKLTSWPARVWLAMYIMCPVMAVSLPLFGYERDVSIGKVIANSIAYQSFGSFLIFLWFAVLTGFSSWDIHRNWPNHKLAIYRMIGGMIGLCIPHAFQAFAVAESALGDTGNGGLGQGVGLLAVFTFIAAPALGVAGVLVGWLCGWFVGRQKKCEVSNIDV